MVLKYSTELGRAPYREQPSVIGRAAEEASWFAEGFPGITYLEVSADEHGSAAAAVQPRLRVLGA